MPSVFHVLFMFYFSELVSYFILSSRNKRGLGNQFHIVFHCTYLVEEFCIRFVMLSVYAVLCRKEVCVIDSFNFNKLNIHDMNLQCDVCECVCTPTCLSKAVPCDIMSMR